MSWFSKKPPPPDIPPHKPDPVHVRTEHAPKEEGIVVEEIDTSAMTRTGIHRAWDRLTGKFKGE